MQKSPLYIKGITDGEIHGYGDPDNTKSLVHSKKVILLKDSNYPGEDPLRHEFSFSDFENIEQLRGCVVDGIDELHKQFAQENNKEYLVSTYESFTLERLMAS
jgi:hypothetical protein